MQYPSPLKSIIGFILLFAAYHAAEYMILFKNSTAGFLLLTFVFFFVAALVAKWQDFKNLGAWGITFNRKAFFFLGIGLLIGLVANALAFLTCLLLHIETITFIPSFNSAIAQASLLIFGTFFSSLSEDVLTRGYIFRHLNPRVNGLALILISSLVYVLNHIHRLNEPVYLLYLFLIGIQLIIPLLFTKNIWYTLGVHWGGNIVYHITNSVMHTGDGNNTFPSMYIFIVFMALLIPVNYFVCKSISKEKSVQLPVLI